MLYLRLFQKINTKQKNLELHDIVVQFKFTSVHNEDIQKRTQIPIFNGKTINITPLVESLKLKFFIIEICDKDIATHSNPTINDIILTGDIQNIQFRNYIEPHLETEYTINCTGCEYQNHEVNLCLNLNKLKVYILENDDNNIKIFNEGNFALFVFVDYCNMFYKFKREKGDIDYLEFGENFSSTEGKSGIPLFFHGGSIETSWKQDFESSSAIDSIFSAFDKCYLELLKEGKDIDLIIQNSNLSNEQQEELQQLRIEQEKRVIKFNQIKDGIEQAILENIESLRDFQYWHQKILEATILTQQLQNNLNDLRLGRLEYWLKYTEEYNSFVKQIQNKSDLYKLRNNWIIKIDNSQFTFERKANLHKICKEHIRVLLDQQQKFNYQKIHDGILGETILTNLEVDKYWSKEIHQSSILTNNQRIELNNLCAKTLVTLTNRYYDEIKNEIPKITDTFLLEDKGEIDRRIQIANYDRIERLINTYARRLRVELLANESALAQSLNNLNQTLLGIEPDSECYDLIIQSIDEAFLDLLKTVQVLQNLRRDLYNSIQLSFDVKKINNLKDAFDWLNVLLEKKEKIYYLFNEIISNYIKDYPNGKFTNTQQEENFFNNEINKIEVETCLQEKQFLYNLKEKIIEIYSDEEKDHYFINIEEDIDIFNEDIENFIIKKNIIYKLIREIFKESGEDWIKNISKRVKDTDDVQSFFKLLKDTITNKRLKGLIDKNIRNYFKKKEEKEQEEQNKKHDLDNKNESDFKKPRKQRIMKKEKDYKKELISNI
ncbi:hypothetical protein C2G38_2231525 [Gigaspora rosea]|uniref:Uncharacterized protein n=1 Tax=Gigaspora rosea TaxID=44941 RepID=A0A397TSV5_9GLOM|nr:hypothetical protein C2G38_2231525 [Gigaspora rosea]